MYAIISCVQPKAKGGWRVVAHPADFDALPGGQRPSSLLIINLVLQTREAHSALQRVTYPKAPDKLKFFSWRPSMIYQKEQVASVARMY
jgi:hypothetical protein